MLAHTPQSSHGDQNKREEMKEKKRTIYVRVPVEDARRIMQMLWRVGQMSFYEQISYNRFTRSLGNAQRREARLYDVKVAR